MGKSTRVAEQANHDPRPRWARTAVRRRHPCDLLHVGGLGLLGAGLGGTSCLAASSGEQPPPLTAGNFGRAKACIFLFLYGSPSQLETFDPKPDAPSQIRGEFRSIPSTVPGLDVCELLPRMAGVMDKVTVLRSVSHPFPLHGVAYATTGLVGLSAPQELSPRDPGHWPYIGSVVDYMDSYLCAVRTRRGRKFRATWCCRGRSVVSGSARLCAGPYGGFLGQAWDPVSTEFVGKATTTVRKTLQDKIWEDLEPYRGITPESRFRLGAVSDLPAELTLDRLDRRRNLLEQIEATRRELDRAPSVVGVDRQRV